MDLPTPGLTTGLLLVLGAFVDDRQHFITRYIELGYVLVASVCEDTPNVKAFDLFAQARHETRLHYPRQQMPGQTCSVFDRAA